jgi:hypothetical protein
MANTTFNGPVRSENGFEDITVAASTGTVTTNSTYGTNAVVGGTITGRKPVNTDWNAATTLTATLTAAQSGTLFLIDGTATMLLICLPYLLAT